MLELAVDDLLPVYVASTLPESFEIAFRFSFELIESIEIGRHLLGCRLYHS